MAPITSSPIAARAIKNYYDIFAPHYDHFYEEIDYATWAALIQNHLDQLLPLPRRILDVGCGTGALLQHLVSCRDQSCVGLDLSRGMLRHCQNKFASKQKPALVQGDLAVSCFQENCFDAVLGVFSFLNLFASDERKTLLQEIRRLLKTNGIFLTDFFTVRRYHQLLNNQKTSYAEAPFKIEQVFLPPLPDSARTDPHMIERRLTTGEHSASKRLYFLEPQQIQRELHAAGFDTLKITTLVPDISVTAANRLMLIGRKR
jgi:ubiquinone/menaquinone biosynthesis C-methylase UbiE